jgi:hypothetical protein
MATYSDYQQRLLDQGASIEEVEAARRPTRRMTYRQAVLEIDPKATLHGPIRIGHYVNYVVKDGNGREIGWTEGNEQGTGEAWMRAYSTLTRGQA